MCDLAHASILVPLGTTAAQTAAKRALNRLTAARQGADSELHLIQRLTFLPGRKCPPCPFLRDICLKQFYGGVLCAFERRWPSLPDVQVGGFQQVKATRLNLVGTAQSMIGALIAVIAAIIGVVNTMLMSVHEPTGEIGMMKAIGARRTDIFEFQKCYLLPALTAVENVELPLLILDREVSRDETLSLREEVGFADRATHLLRELWGRQMQLVAIARALIMKPKVLIADEPTENLDRTAGEKIFFLLEELVVRGWTVLVPTHNQSSGTGPIACLR